MKTQVYDTPVEDAKKLIARISVAVGEIRDMPGESKMFGFPCAGDVRYAL